MTKKSTADDELKMRIQNYFFLNHEKIFYKKIYSIILFILSVNDLIPIFAHF